MAKTMTIRNKEHYMQKENLKYKAKYKRIKKLIKDYIFENAALCDQVAEIQENIAIIKDERRYLIKKLLEHETEANILVESPPNNLELPIPELPVRKRKKKTYPDTNEKSKTLVKNEQVVQVVETQEVPSFPLYLGSLTVHTLGDIVPDNTNFHAENWIYPVGYLATRVYSHPREPERKCTFTCKILNNSGVPQFQIIPDADYDHVFFGESANICHQGLLETIARSTDVKNFPIRPQGELFFGLGHSSVVSQLQIMPNINKCANFKQFQIDSTTDLNTENDPTINFDALQKFIAISVYHIVPEIKEEPPDELLE